MLDIIDLHDTRRVPLNQAERAAKPGLYPYFGANGQVDTIGDYLFDGDYVLLAEDGGYFDEPTRGVAYKVSGRFWVNNHAHILSSRGEIPHEFLSLLLNYVDWMPYVSGTTRLKLTQGGMSRVSVPLPPLAEQRRIVAKLDSLTARIARAREELKRSHKLVASLKTEALATADNGDRTGRIAPWLAAPIRNGLSVKGSDMPPGVRALRLSALRADVVDLDAVRHLPISVARAAPFLLKADDILVSRGNGTLALVGRASRVPLSLNTTSTIFPDTAFRLRFDPAQVDVTWLLHVWNSPLVRQQIEARARTTAGIWKISQVDLNEIALPKLSLAEQRAAASRISAILARANCLEAEAVSATALLDRLETSILAKAFRGELVPQDPTDEPASALLDRIRTERAEGPARPGRHRARGGTVTTAGDKAERKGVC